MSKSLIREFDQITLAAPGPGPPTQTNSLFFQRTHSDYGTFQIESNDITDASAGSMFIIGRPIPEADFITVRTIADISTGLAASQFFENVPLLLEMRVLFNQVATTDDIIVNCFVQGT